MSDIKMFRLETGLTQEQFANYYRLPVRTLQEWEQGRHEPPKYLLFLLRRIWDLEHIRR